MASGATGTLDEAYERLHTTGPEFDGWLSNHGPMAAEAMVRHGHAESVPEWLDGYMERLEEFPRGTGPIGADWQEALGDPRRIADWTAYFRREVTEQPWREALETWWPRLLPGVAAAATHGVIRVGHAVRALRETARTPIMSPNWPMAWPTGPPAGTGTRCPGHRAVPRHRVWRGRGPGRGRARSGSGRAYGGRGAGCCPADRRPVRRHPRPPRPAGRPARLAARGSRAAPAGLADGLRSWLAGLVDAAATRYLGTGTATASCWCTRPPPRTR